MKTSEMFTEGERCPISELPLPWCGCWKCRPDVTTDYDPGHIEAIDNFEE